MSKRIPSSVTSSCPFSFNLLKVREVVSRDSPAKTDSSPLSQQRDGGQGILAIA